MEGSVIFFPATVFVEQTMTIYGTMMGLDHLYTRGVSRLTNDGNLKGYLGLPITGAYQLTSVTVLNGGKVALNDTDYTTEGGVYIVADFINVQHGGLFEVSPSGTVFGGVFDIEKSGSASGLRLGYTPKSGPGAGSSCNAGAGAAHAGNGGRGYATWYCNQYCTGSTNTYGDACLPIKAGSGGGKSSYANSDGGWGGSAFKVIARNAMYLEGKIDMDGSVGVLGGGGGSGGAVWLDSEIIEGWGEVSANGGGGTNVCTACARKSCCCNHQGGGGGGGRIRTYTGNYTHKVLFKQRYVAGGNGYNNGGSGSLCQSPGSLCSNHGNYMLGACSCNSGYVGTDCQYRCSSTETCSGHGSCAVDGTCVCVSGYVGHRCDSQCHDDTTCSGHGQCTTTGTCICDACYGGDDCSVMCGGQGQCIGEKCDCDDCHLGELCDSECNGHGNCIDGICSCLDNWQEDKCTRPGCPSMTSDSCSGNGICMAGIGTCICDPGWSGQYNFINFSV